MFTNTKSDALKSLKESAASTFTPSRVTPTISYGAPAKINGKVIVAKIASAAKPAPKAEAGKNQKALLNAKKVERETAKTTRLAERAAKKVEREAAKAAKKAEREAAKVVVPTGSFEWVNEAYTYDLPVSQAAVNGARKFMELQGIEKVTIETATVKGVLVATLDGEVTPPAKNRIGFYITGWMDCENSK